MYLHTIDVFADDSIVDYYKDGFCQKFGWQTMHITRFLTALLFRKVRSDFLAKIVCHFFPFNTELPKDKMCSVSHVLIFNTHFDFFRYNEEGKSEKERSRMIANKLKEELVINFKKYNLNTDALLKAFETIEEKEYVFSGICKKSLHSPNKKYTIKFKCYWRLGGIDFYVIASRYRSRSILCQTFLSTIRSDYNTIEKYIDSVEWISEDEFVCKMNDLIGKKKLFNIPKCESRNFNTSLE